MLDTGCLVSSFYLILKINKYFTSNAAKSKLCDYVVTMDGHSVIPCAAVKYLVVYQAHVDTIIRIAIFISEIAKIKHC